MTPSALPPPASCPLVFVRHGATEPNLAGLRCGGDLDAPLTEVGRREAVRAAQRIRAQGLRIGVIVASDLQRTRETAAIIAREFEGIEIVIEPGFAERRLGAWNLLPIVDTEPWLVRGLVPPGGESDEAFSSRIAAAVHTLLPRGAQRPLLVGSKGVARVLGKLLSAPERAGFANGEVAQFELAGFAAADAAADAAAVAAAPAAAADPAAAAAAAADIPARAHAAAPAHDRCAA